MDSMILGALKGRVQQLQSFHVAQSATTNPLAALVTKSPVYRASPQTEHIIDELVQNFSDEEILSMLEDLESLPVPYNVGAVERQLFDLFRIYDKRCHIEVAPESSPRKSLVRKSLDKTLQYLRKAIALRSSRVSPGWSPPVQRDCLACLEEGNAGGPCAHRTG